VTDGGASLLHDGRRALDITVLDGQSASAAVRPSITCAEQGGYADGTRYCVDSAITIVAGRRPTWTRRLQTRLLWRGPRSRVGCNARWPPPL
jgi:hypothetical protein